MSNTKFVEIQGAITCPVCDKQRRCKVTSDGSTVVCFRCRKERVGDFRRIKAHDECCTFVLDDSTAPPRNGRGANGNDGGNRIALPKPKPLPPDHFKEMHERFAKAITAVQIRTLADELGVAADALQSVGVGWSAADEAYTFPEYNEGREIIGIMRRYPDGKKRSVERSRRGLIIPADFHPGHSLVLLVEGASCVAALLTVGIDAVGRPNNSGGADFIIELFHGPVGRVLIGGENDTAGCEGADKLGTNLSEAWRKPVPIIYPPEDVKDWRELVHTRRKAGNSPDQIRAEIESLIVEVPTPGESPKPSPPGATDRGRLAVPSPDAQAAPPETDPKEVRYAEQTDTANAERLIARNHGKIYHSKHAGWVVWDGCRFRLDRIAAALCLAIESARSIEHDAATIEDRNRRHERFRWAAKCQDKVKLDGALSVASAMVDINLDGFDENLDLFNLANGTLDLRTFELHEHDPGDMNTKISSVIFEPKAECPAFIAFLNEIFEGDNTLCEFWQRFMGYAIGGGGSDQSVFICHGSGNNAKTQLVTVMAGLMGEYARSVDASTLVVRKNSDGSTASPDIARLAGARLVNVGENEADQKLAESLIKRLTGGDAILARHLFKKPFEFVLRAAVLFQMNHRPIIQGTDTAIWRRIRLIPFDYVVPAEKRVLNFAETRLIPELSGILNFALEGLREWRQGGLRPPSRVMTATEDFRVDSDTVGQWLNECCEVGPALSETNERLVASFNSYATKHCLNQMDGRALGRTLSERGFQPRRDMRSRGRDGLSVKPDP